MSAPMSERQQMKLLEKQEKEEAERAAASSAAETACINQDDQQEDIKTTARRSKKSSAKAKNKSQTKKRSNSLTERKKAGRQQAAAKKQEETSASEENAFTTSQEEDDEEEEPDYGDDDNSSDSEIEFMDDTPQKKAPPTRSTRASRKRQLSDDMSLEDESNAGSQNERDDMAKQKSRLKKKLSRKRTHQNSSSLFDSDGDNDEETGRTDGPAKKQSISTDKPTISIPKKGAIPKKTMATIPKKGDIPRRKLTADGKGGDKKVSLLQNMAPGNASFHQITSSSTIPASSASVQPANNKPTVRNSSSLAEADRARPSSQVSSLSQPIPKSPTPQQPTPTMHRGMTPPPPQGIIMGSGQGDYITQQHPPASLSMPSNSKEAKENRVFEALGTMCDSLNKQGRFQIRTGPAIDMSGSFLSNDRYDFFDVDSQGDIMLQAKIPIFPEEFPPGKTEWPLSWWGIVDPVLAPTPTIMEEVELTTGADSKEVTVAVKEWETRPQAFEKQNLLPPLLNPGLPPPPPNTGRPPPTSYLSRPPPSQFDASGRGHFGAGRGGRGAPSWPSRGGAHAGRGPPPLHGMPPPSHMQGSSSVPPPHQFPPGRGPARGRGGMRPGDRPPPSRHDGNMRPPRGRY